MNQLPPHHELITASIPQGWAARIDALCAGLGQTRAEWLYDRIAEALYSAAGEKEAIASLTARLTALEAKVDRLHLPVPLMDTSQGRGAAHRAASTPIKPLTDVEEDEFDEPDEILWSFAASSSTSAAEPASRPNKPSLTDEIEDEPDEVLDRFLDEYA
ncbi:MAG: hypothetical protein VKK04_14320 [Synechococcales bacterium]|nr:hypothetical protein [Synechococcales bacterium]